jgi:aryl-alcohol dehydrogenase-like predicted oxidoreductase
MANVLEKRTLGSTKLQVSRLCYGTLALGAYHTNLSVDRGAELLVYAYNAGINFWDTAELYETYKHIREAVKRLNNPADLVIASRSFSRTYREMELSILHAQQSLEMEKLQIFGLHELEGEEDFEESQGAFQALKEAKQEGIIEHIAITMHSVKALEIATAQPWVDVVFPLYNIAGLGIKDGSVEDMTAAIQRAREVGKGVYAMKVLAGGHLVPRTEQCIDFALHNDYIDSIAIGMDNTNEIEMNLAIFKKEHDKVTFYKTKVDQHTRCIQVDPWCEGCGACIRICPNDAITLEFSQAKIDPEKCILCGYCASACRYFCLKVVNQQ